MKVHARYERGQCRSAILFTLITASVVLSLSCKATGERNAVTAVSNSSTASVQAASQKTDSPADDHSAFCKEERDRVRNGLREIFVEYRRTESTKPIRWKPRGGQA